MNQSVFAKVKSFPIGVAILLFVVVLLRVDSSRAQGMPIDTLRARLTMQLNERLFSELRTLIPDYDNERVWGLAVGDFSNDSLPDLAISLYDLHGPMNVVTVYLFQNLGGRNLEKMLERKVHYVESPIEVGLLAENSVLTIIQKTGEQSWMQEGYTVEDGDVVLVDHFETARQTIAGAKPKYLAHEQYRNYETLLSREAYFSGASGDPMFDAKFYTFPAYRRLKNVYPGYGYGLSDTSSTFITTGLGLRKNAQDLSIRDAVTSYDDDYLYVSISVTDNVIIGNSPRDEANDRVSLWFDIDPKHDRRTKTTASGVPVFRDLPDSNLYNVTFILPASQGKVSRLLYSSDAPLNAMQKDAMGNIKAMMNYDSAGGRQTGYTLRARIPFAFLGFESNPVNAYERVPSGLATSTDTSMAAPTNTLSRAELEDAPSLGFTALVYDVDDPAHPNEVKIQATSKFRINDPSTFGTLILEPGTKFYGEVVPTYETAVKEGLSRAGF